MQSRSRHVLRPLIAGLTLLSALTSSARAQPEIIELLRKVPDTANVLTLVRVNDLFGSTIALRENWAAEGAASNPMAQLVPEANYIAFASEVDIPNGFEPRWQLAMLDLKRPTRADRIAESEGGKVDEVGGQQVVWSPRDLYIVPFTPRQVGILAPVDRPFLGRWLGETENRLEPALSDYLRQVARTFQGIDAQYVTALDLKYLFTPQLLKPHVVRATSIDPKVDDIDAIAASLASIRGAVLGIKADVEIEGLIRIDFDQSTAPLERVAKPLLYETLQNFGAEIEDLRDWRILVEENTITLRGKLTSEAARRLASLTTLPTEAAVAGPGDTPAPGEEPTSPGEVSAQATRKYFNSVTNLVDDLRSKDDSHRTLALWCNRYADKIDRLPILGVDAEMLDFGRAVSITLRNLATSAQGVSLNINARSTTEAAQSIGYGGYGGYYGYGYGGSIEGGTSRAVFERIAKQEKVAATATQVQIWNALQVGIADMRRKMTERYGIEF